MKVEINFDKWYEDVSITRKEINNYKFDKMEVRKYGSLILISEERYWCVCYLKQKNIPPIDFDPFFIERILKEIEDHESRN